MQHMLWSTMQLDLGKHGADHGHLQSNMNNHGNGIFTDANIVKQSCETNRAIGAIVVISMADRELKFNGAKMGEKSNEVERAESWTKGCTKVLCGNAACQGTRPIRKVLRFE